MVMNRKLTQSQKIMVFILSMCMFGLGDLITQLVPDITVGPIELGISYFGFIGMIMCVLLDPFYGAIGSCFGAIIFGGLLIGDFKGIGELESFIQMSMAFFLASLLIKNVKNKTQIFWAGMFMVAVDKFVGGFVDVLKVWIGVEEFEAAAGLPESVLAIQGVEFLTDTLVTGIFFTAIPAMIFIPMLHGKLEPLLGMKPRQENESMGSLKQLFTIKNTLIMIVLAAASAGFAILKETGVEFLAFKPDFVDMYGDMFMYIAIGVVALLTVGVTAYCSKNKTTLTKETN